MSDLRSKLGEFSSIVCLKAIITGMEDTLGDKATEIALVSAGRIRGKKLAMDGQLGSLNMDENLEEITKAIAEVLGADGTRLLLLHKIECKDDLIYTYCTETVCSAGEDSGSSRQCSFTLGALQGVLEIITERRLRGVQIESVLRGGEYDVFEYGSVLR